MKTNCRLLFALFVVAFVFNAFAQKQHRHKHFFVRGDVNKLAHKITKNAESEYEKSVRIHEWITHNIKYDVKKFVARDYKRDNAERVLRRRKAICLGYADLYDELSAAAGLKSTMVAGYSKASDVDVCDSFYLDEHAWNAVKADSIWYLVDNTWDAGYIKWYRFTVPSFVAYRIFQIPYIRMKYKPRFKFAPHELWMNKSGEFFSTDHMASQEMWQFTEEIIDIETWQRDSTSYYHKFKENIYVNPENDRRQMNYISKTKQDKLIYDGKPVNQYNQRNHYTWAGSYYERARKLYNSLVEEESLAKSKYEYNVRNLTKAIQHTDSNAMYLEKQEVALIRNNKDKREIHKTYNRQYAKYLDKNLRQYSTRKSQLRSLKRAYKKQAKMYDKQVDNLYKSDKYDEKEFKHKYEEKADSIAMEYVLDSVQEALQLRIDTVIQHVQKLGSMDSYFSSLFVNEVNYTRAVGIQFNLLWNLRAQGEDDYDYYLQQAKSQFTSNDSFLYLNEGSVMDSLKEYMRSSRRSFSSFKRTYSAYARGIRRMKRMHQANDALDERYTNSLEYFETTNKLIFQWYVEIQSVLANHKSGYKQIRKRSKKANKHVKIEYAIYKPNSVIRNHISGLESANKHLQRSAKRLKRRNERIIGKIERLERG